MAIEVELPEAIWFSLGFIGHAAAELQELFGEFSPEPNDYGYFLKFENYTELVVNNGVFVQTNCFSTEEEFIERLLHKLLFNFTKDVYHVIREN